MIHGLFTQRGTAYGTFVVSCWCGEAFEADDFLVAYNVLMEEHVRKLNDKAST